MGVRWLLLLGAFVSALAFVGIARAIDHDGVRDVDERLVLAMRTPSDPSDPIGPLWFEEAVRDVTALGSLTLLCGSILVVACVDLLARRPRAALLLLLTMGAGIGCTFLVKAQYGRPRPDLVPHEARTLTASFPSGHAAIAAMVYLTLGALVARLCRRRRFRALSLLVAVALAAGVGSSRVYLGVHWPSDVAAGWAFGATWALLAWAVEGAARRRGWIEPLSER